MENTMSSDSPATLNSFCVVPWVHAHVGANGSRGLCCVAEKSPYEVAHMKWSEFKNSDYMKSIRVKMLSGELPKECAACANSNRIVTVKDNLNELYKNEIPNILKSTAADGTSNAPLKYLDYRSLLCNLSCRTCTPDSSSSYQRVLNSQPEVIGNTLFYKGYTRDTAPTLQRYSAQYFHELSSLAEEKSIDRIYFAGGEPVIEPNHLPLLESLIEKGRAPNINIDYNTNLSFSQKILEKWLNLIPQFRSCTVYVSIDGVGDVCEYIREGVSFELLNRNIDKLISTLTKNTRVEMDITLTSLNLFFLEDFAEYALSKHLPVTSKFIYGAEHRFPMLHTEAIPEKIKASIVERWNTYYQNLDGQKQNLLKNLNASVCLFADRKQWASDPTGDRMHRLKLFESMYPEKGKFIHLLSQDKFGESWVQILMENQA